MASLIQESVQAVMTDLAAKKLLSGNRERFEEGKDLFKQVAMPIVKKMMNTQKNMTLLGHKYTVTFSVRTKDHNDSTVTEESPVFSQVMIQNRESTDFCSIGGNRTRVMSIR